MAIFEIVIASLLVFIAVVVRYLLQKRGYLETLGIPVIKPFFIFGSPPFCIHDKIIHEETMKNHKKFGKTFGRYDGREAVISTIDPELIKTIMVKQFENFADIVDWEMPERQLTIDFTSGEKWKSLRKGLSPTFTSGKLKAMLEPMDDIVENLINHIQKEVKKNPVIEMKNLFQELSSTTEYPLSLPWCMENKINLCSKQRMQLSRFENLFAIVFSHITFLNKYTEAYSSASRNLFDLTKELMQDRRASNIVKDDFISRLNDLLDSGDPNISEDLAVAQGIIFFAAGFETTASTMSTLAYNLAKYPEIQEKAFEEIQECLESSSTGKIDYETMTHLNYLEAVINENLRLNGPANDNFRVCAADTEANGMKFVKGTRIWMPTWASHHNEEFFPDPEKFDPERFLKENSGNIIPFTFRPFGGGNRMCIGLRFAMNEMKLCMSRLLHKYRFELAPESKLEYNPGSFFMLSFDEVKVRIVPRN